MKFECLLKLVDPFFSFPFLHQNKPFEHPSLDIIVSQLNGLIDLVDILGLPAPKQIHNRQAAIKIANSLQILIILDMNRKQIEISHITQRLHFQ